MNQVILSASLIIWTVYWWEVKQYLIRATETEFIKNNIDAEVRSDVFVYRSESNRIEHNEDAFYPLG